jgi:hypothetical protein
MFQNAWKPQMMRSRDLDGLQTLLEIYTRDKEDIKNRWMDVKTRPSGFMEKYRGSVPVLQLRAIDKTVSYDKPNGYEEPKEEVITDDGETVI